MSLGAPSARPASVPFLVLQHRPGGPVWRPPAAVAVADGEASAAVVDADAAVAVDFAGSLPPAAFPVGCAHFVQFSSLNCFLIA